MTPLLLWDDVRQAYVRVGGNPAGMVRPTRQTDEPRVAAYLAAIDRHLGKRSAETAQAAHDAASALVGRPMPAPPAPPGRAGGPIRADRSGLLGELIRATFGP